MGTDEQTDRMPEPTLNKARHIKYWLRCLKTFLPTAYTPNDSQRMTFAFFTLSALDLLSALDDHITPEERQGYVDWICHCQHPNGGFKGFTGADGGVESPWDPANLAATFFALAGLMVLGDDLRKVKKRDCLAWVKRLQTVDGSFGEALGKGGKVEGGGDVRYCYLAAAVRWILRRGESMETVPDIDASGLRSYVLDSVTYEGGFAKGPFQEAHAGWTYCAIGCLKLLGYFPDAAFNLSMGPSSAIQEGAFFQNLLRWLVSRQTTYIQDENDGEPDEESLATAPDRSQGFHKVSSHLAVSEATSASIEVSADLPQCAGFNGRCNKMSDTCYAFWVGASLAMLHSLDVQDFDAARRYLLDKTQHTIGGFGKLVGDSPDILHSCLGLSALAIMGESELRPIDPTLCISIRAKEDFKAKSGAKSNFV